MPENITLYAKWTINTYTITFLEEDGTTVLGTSTADYGTAFETIDSAIRSVANKVFYTYGADSYDKAYDSFKDYNYVQTVRSQLHKKRS